MTLTLRIVLILASIGTSAMILNQIRKSKLKIEDSIYWLGFSFLLLICSVFPAIPDFLSNLAGTYTTANFIYLVVIFLLIVKLFQMSLQLSKLENRTKELVQELAIEKKKIYDQYHKGLLEMRGEDKDGKN